MTRTTCPTCNQTYRWNWEEAFSKYGFDDGDGLMMTDTVADTLRKAGFTVETMAWGIHNVIISQIERDGVSQLPALAIVGRDNPRTYLPADIVALLDREIPADSEVEVQL